MPQPLPRAAHGSCCIRPGGARRGRARPGWLRRCPRLPSVRAKGAPPPFAFARPPCRYDRPSPPQGRGLGRSLGLPEALAGGPRALFSRSFAKIAPSPQASLQRSCARVTENRKGSTLQRYWRK